MISLISLKLRTLSQELADQEFFSGEDIKTNSCCPAFGTTAVNWTESGFTDSEPTSLHPSPKSSEG